MERDEGLDQRAAVNLDLAVFAREAPPSDVLNDKINHVMDHFADGFVEWMQMTQGAMEIATEHPEGSVEVNAELFGHMHHLISYLLVMRHRAQAEWKEKGT